MLCDGKFTLSSWPSLKKAQELGYYCNLTSYRRMLNGYVFLYTVPPIILRDSSPPSVICKMKTLCTLLCRATSAYTVSYSWTKDGKTPKSDDVKVMNDIIIVRPRHVQDYGVYMCHASNIFGSTTYKITLTECQKS